MDFPIPSNEHERLQVINDLDLMETVADESYDFLVEVAADLLSVPVAFIAFLDDEQQLFKSKIGLDYDSTSRELAFCSYNIMDTDVMVVPDTHLDERFKDHPSVIDDPKIRFYAGSPITLFNNVNVGTICVIDHKPREITSKEEQILVKLSNQVKNLLELKKRSMDLRTLEDTITNLQKYIILCSWCDKIKNSEGDWINKSEIVISLPSSNFTHTICSNCKGKMIGSLDGEEIL